uniref:DUF1488 family protein n=1 Tax=Cupriavidus cauae TaxID=2608999 RepID=UPI0022434AE2|nr:DUF1488 family protein [Cupriavidus cauae]
MDGALCTYAVTAQALEEHFATSSYRKEDLVSAFADHRDEIERGCANLLRDDWSALHRGHFRFAA